MTKILGLSGKKQCGKTTTCNFLFGLEMVSQSMVSHMKIDNKGRLCIPILVEDQTGKSVIAEGCIDPLDRRPEVQNWYQQTIWPFLKIYSLADPLKWICQEVIGLTFEQCNGTNEQKDEMTEIRWDTMPLPMRIAKSPTKVKDFRENKFGRMSGREIMQWVGTEMFRSFLPNAWIDATLRRINREQPELAIISDVRFPNEVEGIQKAGGKVIRFLRDPFKDSPDRHESETALDHYEGDFDAIIANENVGISRHNQMVHELLLEWGYLQAQTEAMIS